MIIQALTLLTLLATVACSDGVLSHGRPPVSSAANTAFTRPPNGHTLLRRRSTTTQYHDPNPPVTSPYPTNKVITRGQHVKYPHTETSTVPNIITATTEEPHPAIQNPFITDALTPSNILILPRNETVSRILFWPPSPGINVTLNIMTANNNFTLHDSTVLPQHWHSIDIYQPTLRDNKARVTLHTAGRFLNFNKSRVIQMQVGSDHSTHWCFCPNAHLCTLLSPLEYGGGGSSGERMDLLAALLVVVFLLIVTLLALGVVTFYRKKELFHIYAKPIDCLPSTASPPPLPKPNKESGLHGNGDHEAKQVEIEKIDLNDDSGYSKVRSDADKAAPSITPLTKAAYEVPCKPTQKRESINSLYGLI